MRCYSLECRLNNGNKTNWNEILREKNRRAPLMSSLTIEELDGLTSKFISLEDLNLQFKELYGSNFDIEDLVIIADPDDEDYSKSYFISDIAYEEDKKSIDDCSSIRGWALDYLKKNPDNIKYFSGIRDIWKNKYFDRQLNEDILKKIVYAYFVKNEYKKRRDTYFVLRSLDRKRDKKNEIHR